MNEDFARRRRQPFIDEQSFNNTIAHFRADRELFATTLGRQKDRPFERTATLGCLAGTVWNEVQLRYTAGCGLEELARFMTEVVESYESQASSSDLLDGYEYRPVFNLDEIVDEYVDYLGMLSVAVLLHREDLIPRIHALLEGTDYDGTDLVIEELLSFYLPERPVLDEWWWNKPYNMLVDAIDSETAAGKAKAMKKYVSKWYSSMKGQAHFWGKHEQVTAEFSPYFGYWAMCAGAFTYLHDIDDGSYRDEIVYPKDLVDYARSIPRRPVNLGDGREMLRVVGGQPCPREGIWFTPAKADSSRHFRVGEIMPVFDSADYGMTIWQLSA